jgi:hypothetical protein
MSEKTTLLALFANIDPAAAALDQLRALGLADDQMNVISGIPVTEAVLGRPQQWSNVPRLALGGAVAGFAVGLFLSMGTPLLYPILVGGQPLIHGAPTVVVVFEMTMLGLLVSTFVGVFLDSRYPSYTPKEYVAEISDGKIAVLFDCPAEAQDKFVAALTSLGAESVQPVEAQRL